jgi:hypothetical protein
LALKIVSISNRLRSDDRREPTFCHRNLNDFAKMNRVYTQYFPGGKSTWNGGNVERDRWCSGGAAEEMAALGCGLGQKKILAIMCVHRALTAYDRLLLAAPFRRSKEKANERSHQTKPP